MDRQRVVRTLEALIYLAFDQAGRPEGANAYSKAIAWVAKHGVRASELHGECLRHANALHLVFAPQDMGSQDRWSRPSGSASWEPKWKKPDPPEMQFYRPSAAYVDRGYCARCRKPFVRGKDHSGMAAKYCCPRCFEDARRDEARERMRVRRQRARKGS